MGVRSASRSGPAERRLGILVMSRSRALGLVTACRHAARSKHHLEMSHAIERAVAGNAQRSRRASPDPRAGARLTDEKTGPPARAGRACNNLRAAPERSAWPSTPAL